VPSDCELHEHMMQESLITSNGKSYWLDQLKGKYHRTSIMENVPCGNEAVSVEQLLARPIKKIFNPFSRLSNQIHNFFLSILIVFNVSPGCLQT